jgi:hypothetical protein
VELTQEKLLVSAAGVISVLILDVLPVVVSGATTWEEFEEILLIGTCGRMVRTVLWEVEDIGACAELMWFMKGKVWSSKVTCRET